MSSAHMYGLIMRRLTGVPVVATAHSRHVQPWWNLNDRVIANSNATARFHRRINRVPASRLETVHCFVDFEKFGGAEKNVQRAIRRQWRFEPESRVIVIAGDVVPHKGHLYLFQALPQLVQTFPDLRVVVVGRFRRGEAWTDRLRKYLIRNQLYKRVKWIGRRNNMHEMLAAANVVAIPSTVESFGMVALESMAAGTPVVAARTGGLMELIEHERNGLLTRPRDSRELADGITRVLLDPHLNHRLIEQGQQSVLQNYSPSVLTGQIEQVLWKTCRDRRIRLGNRAA